MLATYRTTKTWSYQASLLCSVTGVGPVTADVRAADLPKLEQLSHRTLASLVGVAPLNRNSGQLRGKCHIWSGRASVRRILYTAALTSIRHNPAIGTFYKRPCEKGKPKKVARVAAMHKLLTVLNAMTMIRDLVLTQREPITKPINT